MKFTRQKGKKIIINVLLMPHTTIVSDFDPLCDRGDTEVRFVTAAEDIRDPDILIMPGTKNTIEDMRHIKDAGLGSEIRRLWRKRIFIFGIGGGFQMLGTKIIDIKGSEYGLSQCEGFGFLNVVTRIMPSKVSADVRCKLSKNGLITHKRYNSAILSGFESHLGRTKYLSGSCPLFRIIERDGNTVDIEDGAVNNERNVMGTYIHGLFHNDSFRNSFFDAAAKKRKFDNGQ